MNREILILRQTVVKLTQLLTGMGLNVTQQGTSAFVQVDQRTQKPIRINIPNIPDEAKPELLMAIQGFVDHEVAHVLFTDWSIVRKSNAKGEKFNALRNLLEDTFIEREMAKKFPGSAFNVKQLHNFFLSDITGPALKQVGADIGGQFAVLLVPLVRALSGQKIFQDYMAPHMGQPLIKALMEKLPAEVIAKIPKIKSTQDSFDLAQVFFDIIHPPKPPSSGDASDKSDEKECNDKGKGGSESKPKPEPKESEKEDEKPAAADFEEDEERDEPVENDEEDEEEAPASPKPKPEPEDEEDEDEEEDDEPAAADDDDEESGEKPSSGDDEADGDDEPADDAEDGSGDDGESDDGDESDDEADDEGSDDDGEDEGDAGAGKSGDDDRDGEGDEGEGAGEVVDDTESDEDQEQPEKTEYAEAEADEGGKGNPEPNPFEAADVPATVDFEDALSDHIRDEAKRDTMASQYCIFSRDFDRIERLKPHPQYQDAWLTSLEDRTRSMVGLMQKEIERMMAARSQVVKVPGYRSGRLNSAGLHRLMSGDDRVFRRLHESKSKDTVVGLLIDNSGSMASHGKIGVAMASGFALAQTLEKVGIKNEVIGFTTTNDAPGFSWNMVQSEQQRLGRMYSRLQPLYMPIYKDFDERLTPEVKRRFASTAAYADFMQSNIDGECVEIAIQRLARRNEKRKVLLVLSDGNPAGAGVPREQNWKLKTVVQEAPKFGVDLMGIGIMDASVAAFYPRHVVLSNLNDLPKQVMGEMKRILSAA